MLPASTPPSPSSVVSHQPSIQISIASRAPAPSPPAPLYGETLPYRAPSPSPSPANPPLPTPPAGVTSPQFPRRNIPRGASFTCPWHVRLSAALVVGVVFLTLFLPLLLLYPRLGALQTAQRVFRDAQSTGCGPVANTTLLRHVTEFLGNVTARMGSLDAKLQAMHAAIPAQTANLTHVLETELQTLKTDMSEDVHALLAGTSFDQAVDLTASLASLCGRISNASEALRANLTASLNGLFGASTPELRGLEVETRASLGQRVGLLQSSLANHTSALLRAQAAVQSQLAANLTMSLSAWEAGLAPASRAACVNVTAGVRAALEEQLVALHNASTQSRAGLAVQLDTLGSVLANQSADLAARSQEYNASVVLLGAALAGDVERLRGDIGVSGAATRANGTLAIHAASAAHHNAVQHSSNATRVALAAELAAVHATVQAQSARLNLSLATPPVVNLTAIEALLALQHAALNATLHEQADANLTAVHVSLAAQHANLTSALAAEARATRNNVTALRARLTSEHTALGAVLRRDSAATQYNTTRARHSLGALTAQMHNDSTHVNTTLLKLHADTADLREGADLLRYQIDAMQPAAPRGWGSNADGQVSPQFNTSAPVLSPTTSLRPPHSTLFRTRRFAQIATGADTTLARTPQGDVWGWGANTVCNLGVGPGPESLPTSAPRRVLLPPGERCIDVTTGRYHSLFLMQGGHVYCAGDAFLCGVNQTDPVAIPRRVGSLPAVRRVALGTEISFAIDAAGALWVWGRGSWGQLGLGSLQDALVPQLIPGVPPVCDVSACGHSICAITRAGEVFTWGRNAEGQLGHGDTAMRQTPTRVASLAGHNVTAVTTTTANMFALVANLTGGYYAWGHNDHGQLGNNATSPTLAPVLVQPDAWRGERVVEIQGARAAAFARTLNRVGDSTLYSWGSNELGQLARGSTAAGEDDPIPQRVVGLEAGTWNRFSIRWTHGFVWNSA